MRKKYNIFIKILIIMLIVSCPIVDVKATQSKTGNFNKSYTLTGNGANDMVAIARAQIGRTQSQFGYTEAWCANFVSDCAKLANQGNAIPANGYCYSLMTAVKNAGGYTVAKSEARAGDLVFFSYPTYPNGGAHVELVYEYSGGKLKSIGGNCNINGVSKVYDRSNGSSSSVSYYCVIRPNYKSTQQIPKIPTTIANLGNSFSARIKNSGSSKYVSQIGNDVRLQSLGNDKLGTQIWKFSRNSDGSYTIKSSVKDTLCIDVNQALDTNGANVHLYSNESHANQKWFILKRSNGSYVLRPANSSSRVLDIDGGLWDEGRNIQLWEYSDLSSQTFWIEKCGNVENLGDEFKAIINNSKLWKPIWQQDSGNIVLGREERKNYHRILWHFYRNSETGAYTIYSYLNGKCLDVFDASDADGARVNAWEQNGSDAQQWYIMSRDDGSLYLKAACSSNNLSLDNLSGVDGTNISMSSNLNTDAQKFSIYKLELPRDKSEYTISTSKNQININEKADITINDTRYVISYKLHIIDPNGKEIIIDNKCNPVYTFTGLKTGIYTIYAEIKSPVSTYIGSKTEKCVKIKVGNTTVAVTSVTLNKTSLSLVKGNSTTLTATVNPSNASSKTLTWTSSNTSVATVDNSGKITAKGAGTATITVTTSNGKIATGTVTVENPTVSITSVSLDKTSLTLNNNSSTTLKATINPSDTTDSKTLTWMTSNSKVVTVNNGVVKGIGVGTAIITARTVNGKTATCKVTVQEVKTPTPTKSKVSIAKTKITVKNATYTGKAIKQKVTIKYGKKTLKNGTDYTLSYKNNKNIGKATITIKGKGDYIGTKTIKFYILPKNASKISIKKKSKQVLISWAKDKEISGYNVEYATNKNFKGKKNGKINENKNAKINISKGKTYYVRIRRYKKVSGKKYYSEWFTIKFRA